MSKSEVVFVGRRYEDVLALKNRTGLSDTAILNMVKYQGMPAPIRIGKKKYFDVDLVDHWFVNKDQRDPKVINRAGEQSAKQ